MVVRRGLKATSVAALLILCAAAGATAATATASPPGGAATDLTLRAALQALQRQGLNLVFSNALVKPRYTVSSSSSQLDDAAPLPARAAALLAPFGLTLARQSADVWYVVRATAEPPPAAHPETAPAAEPAAPGIVEEVVVSSSRYRLVRDAHARQRLDAHELELLPSIGRDVLRAVNHLPGQASVGLGARSHMRGGNTNEVLYLVDGVQLIEPFHMADFHALFSAINPALVDSINVYHAGFPAAFGSRLSGVVDMELTEAERPLEGRINVDFINASSQAQGQLAGTQWLVSARRSTVDYLLDYVDQDYGRPKFHDELVRLSRQGETTDVTLGLLYGNDELTLEDGSAREKARADYHNLATWLRATHSFSDDLKLDASAAFTAIDNARSGHLNEAVDALGSLRESREFTVASMQAAVRWRPEDGWLVHAGVEAQHQSGTFEVDIETRYGLLGQPLHPAETVVRDVSAQRQGSLLTGFVSLQNRVTRAVTVEYGWRYDVQELDPVHDSQFSPRFQLSYDAGGAWRAFLNVGRYAQHQNLYELQLDDGLLELNDPQLADQVSVGTDWSFGGRWRLRLEAYWREIDDPWPRFENLYNRWVLLPELHADRINVKPDEARTYGSEVMLDYRPRDNLRWSLSVALARAQERFDSDWRPRPWEQRHTWRGGLDWRPGQWRIGAIAAYHSGWPTTSLVTEPLTDYGRLYDDQLPAYFSLDLHVARRIQMPSSLLEVYFDLSNATFAGNIGGYRYELDDGRLERDRRRLLPPVPVLGFAWSW